MFLSVFCSLPDVGTPLAWLIVHCTTHLQIWVQILVLNVSSGYFLWFFFQVWTLLNLNNSNQLKSSSLGVTRVKKNQLLRHLRKLSRFLNLIFLTVQSHINIKIPTLFSNFSEYNQVNVITFTQHTKSQCLMIISYLRYYVHV